ncbi:hypothetical protein [Legionella gresilensis]|uniref:RraA family protein n=1 Tax=Legionella gresilensis TaxID=91823 RepID=UPI001041777B
MFDSSTKKSIASILINGYCQDINAIRNLSIPFYAKGIYPAASTKNELGKLN